MIEQKYLIIAVVIILILLLLFVFNPLSEGLTDAERKKEVEAAKKDLEFRQKLDKIDIDNIPGLTDEEKELIRLKRLGQNLQKEDEERIHYIIDLYAPEIPDPPLFGYHPYDYPYVYGYYDDYTPPPVGWTGWGWGSKWRRPGRRAYRGHRGHRGGRGGRGGRRGRGGGGGGGQIIQTKRAGGKSGPVTGFTSQLNNEGFTSPYNSGYDTFIPDKMTMFYRLNDNKIDCSKGLLQQSYYGDGPGNPCTYSNDGKFEYPRYSATDFSPFDMNDNESFYPDKLNMLYRLSGNSIDCNSPTYSVGFDGGAYENIIDPKNYYIGNPVANPCFYNQDGTFKYPRYGADEFPN